MTETNDDSQTNNQLNMRPKYPKSKPCQVLPNNRLDKEVQMIANSYNIALFVFVSSKYYVKDNHIYSRERTFLLFKIFHILFTNTLCIYRMFTININTLGSMGHYEDECMKILNVVFYVTYFICYTFIFINDVVQQNNYVVLILKIQEIHGYIDCSEKIRSYVMFTYFGVIFTICIDSLIIVAFYMFFDTLYWFDIITTCYCDIMILSFNINYVISMRILDLLKLYLEEWTIEVLRNVGKNDDEQCIKLLKMYQTIIEAYNLHATIFEKLVG
ncbi:hypothetical protein B5X24_HaOG200996 [Helicoverpa armigera]|nr:hypothetical protein B5X24_HaOG200996 [Helicoverpa armigera]